MLLTLMGNLGMFGGIVPPTPTPTDHGGAGVIEGLSKQELHRRRMRKILKDDDDFIIIALTKWVAENN